jgi:hypothetical protein
MYRANEAIRKRIQIRRQGGDWILHFRPTLLLELPESLRVFRSRSMVGTSCRQAPNRLSEQAATDLKYPASSDEQ